MRPWIVLAVVAFAIPVAANPKATVALLPLDTDRRLDVYGQAIAHELSRALVSGEIEVVVVGAKMAMPERATLIVDGTISAKGDAVAIVLRVRRRIDGTVVDTLTAGAPLAELDRAASDLSSRLLPSVRAQLAALDHLAVFEPAHPIPHPVTPSRPRVVLVAAIASTGALDVEPLRAALVVATNDWATAHARAPQDVDGKQLTTTLATKTVAASTAELAIAFEVAAFTTTMRDGVPISRARVRVRIASAAMVVFDRVIHTDSIVGAKGEAPANFAGHVAREVLAILRPHLQKIGGWR